MTTTTAALAPMTSTALTDDATIRDYPVTVGGVDIKYDMDYVSKISFIICILTFNIF